MRHLEHWGHRLFPKMTFEEVLDRVERLGSKKEVQVLKISFNFYLKFSVCLLFENYFPIKKGLLKRDFILFCTEIALSS